LQPSWSKRSKHLKTLQFGKFLPDISQFPLCKLLTRILHQTPKTFPLSNSFELHHSSNRSNKLRLTASARQSPSPLIHSTTQSSTHLIRLSPTIISSFNSTHFLCCSALIAKHSKGFTTILKLQVTQTKLLLEFYDHSRGSEKELFALISIRSSKSRKDLFLKKRTQDLNRFRGHTAVPDTTVPPPREEHVEQK
jgi:hypothetical protein